MDQCLQVLFVHFVEITSDVTSRVVLIVATLQNAEVNAYCLEYDAAVNSVFLHPFNSQCLTLQGTCFNIRDVSNALIAHFRYLLLRSCRSRHSTCTGRAYSD